MNKEELELWNWKRILIGDVPVEFMLETLVRTIIIYLFLIFILRMLGKRMNAQLTLTELAVMITLGAIVSPAMQLPDRGILPAIVILCCILLLQRGLGQLSFKHKKIEYLAQGDLSLLVKDGVMQLEEMAKTRVSRAQLFGALRTHSIKHLGEVKRVYLESAGIFSVFTYSKPKPGLTIIPEKDARLSQPVERERQHMVCKNCGYLVEYDEMYVNNSCDVCHHKEWTHPINNESA